MAISMIKNREDTTYGVKEFYLDNEADLVSLPKNSPVGSWAFIIATGDVYFINSLGEWVKVS